MHTIVIEGISQELYEEVTKRTRANNRSLAEEALVLIERGLMKYPQSSPEKLPRFMRHNKDYYSTDEAEQTTLWPGRANSNGSDPTRMIRDDE